MTSHFQLIVIGGGAAGFFGAITAAEYGVSDVLILEKSKNVLTKVRISGGGRCNVTHSCLDPKELVGHYPRGHKSLIGPFHRWQAQDTIDWFTAHGVPLKTESDGRMFPATNTSETIVNCLTDTAKELEIQVRTREQVTALTRLLDGSYELVLADGEMLHSPRILIATGGLRGAEARMMVTQAQHEFIAPVPSLFTFHTDDPRLNDLPGVVVQEAIAEAYGHCSQGPILITHWGLSGPGILKLSAWAARELAECDYQFIVRIDWTGGMGSEQVQATLAHERSQHQTRTVKKRSLIKGITTRFWARLCDAAGIENSRTWSNLTKQQTQQLIAQLTCGEFQITAKSTNKDEFVTCGGVKLDDLNLKTMESKAHTGLYFAGEVLNIDGVTGGFNFQAAWTTGHLAGVAIADRTP